MKKTKYLNLAVLVLTFGLFGCSTGVDNEPDPTARTYPQAYNFKSATIPQIKKPVAATDSVNIEAFVTNISYCPPEYMCIGIVGDHIILSETLEPNADEESLFLAITNPLQFEKNHLYVFSVEVKEGSTDTTNYYRLLGYSG